MSVTLNIGQIDTITYRTDCFSSYSRVKKHYIRNHNMDFYHQGDSYSAYVDGYQDEIRDISGNNSNAYDIGDNPSSWFPTNPIVCDKLLLFASFKNETFQNPGLEFDCCYDKLKFYQPALAINALQSWDDHPLGYTIGMYTQYGFNSLDYAWFTELYIAKKNPASTEFKYLVKASGQYYHEGSGISMLSDTPIASANSSHLYFEENAPEKIGRICTCVEFVRSSNQEDFYTGKLGYCGLRDCICTKEELLSRFTYEGSTKPEAYKAIENNFTHGALMIPSTQAQGLCGQTYREGYQGITEHHILRPDIGRFDSTKPYDNLLRIIIIPFISQAEYNAAKASIYTWDSIPVIE